jgi:polyisoprenoid-binding protein YceI
MMRDRVMTGGLIVLAIGIVAIGAIAFIFLRTPEEASGPIESIPLELAEIEPEAAEVESEASDTVPDEGEGAVAEGAVAEEAVASDPEAESSAAEATNLTIFEIIQEESVVRFILGELLRGQQTTVIGSSNQVAGQIAADLNDLSTVQVGVIQVNARTLVTNNNMRNNTIRNRILFTDSFEFITFAPAEITGLPESVAWGESISFEIEGELTIRDVTNEEVFTVTAVPISGTRLEGTATTTVMRQDYNLQIPAVRNVADVDEAVVLEFDFVAVPVEQTG